MEKGDFKPMEARLNKEIIKLNSRITTIVSGGMDSITLLYYALSKTTPNKVTAISFNYGQKHSKELKSAEAICKDLGVNFRLVDLHAVSNLLKSSLTGDENIPHGHYAEDNMKSTVVPNRNAIMLSMAYGSAISDNSQYLLFGAHAGDHFIYPDCRPQFVKAVNKAFRVGNEGFGDVTIKAPFDLITKSEIVTLGLKLKVPYENTWTCYEGKERPCLECGTCCERILSFSDNKIQDPLLTNKEWKIGLKFALKAKQDFEDKKE